MNGADISQIQTAKQNLLTQSKCSNQLVALQLSLNGGGDDEQNVFDTLLIIKIIQSFYENF